MASLTVQRLGNSISWSLHFTTRSRSVAFSFESTERSRPRHNRSRIQSYRHSRSIPCPRTFSTQSTLYQGAQPESSTLRPAQTPPVPTSGPSVTKTSSPTAPPTFRNSGEPLPQTERSIANNLPQEPLRDVSKGLSDMPMAPTEGGQVDWTNSYHGLATKPFSKDASDVLLGPINVDDIEIKPDGIVYLPEIKYRRILNRAFGPGGWGLAPRGETIVTPKAVTREYALLANGRLVSVARGEQTYFEKEDIPTATEGCKSNALMRCCKDLGVASELWDPRFIRKFLAQHAREVWVEHVVTKKRRKMTLRRDDEARYPYQEAKTTASGRI